MNKIVRGVISEILGFVFVVALSATLSMSQAPPATQEPVKAASVGSESEGRTSGVTAEAEKGTVLDSNKGGEIETFAIKANGPTSVRNPFEKSLIEKTPEPAKQAQASSDWQFAFSPYLYATGISGTIGAQGRTIEIDESFGDVLSNLDLGLMGTFEARKGKLIFVSDLIWTKMSVERDTPGDLYSDAKLGVNLFIFDPEVGYRVAESRAGSFDVLAGVRIWSVENNLNLRTGILPGFDVSQRKTFAAPVIGVHGLLNLSPKFYISSKFDVGGFGIGPDVTTQFYGGGGFRVKPNIALIAGYRYMMVDYDDSEGFLFDTNMNGFIFGAKFSF